MQWEEIKMSQQGNQEQGTKMYCIMCGGEIDSDSQFCYLCGAKLDTGADITKGPKSSEEPVISVEPKTSQQGSNKAVPTRRFRKGLIIGVSVLLYFCLR